ncbi:MAG TPA: Hsp20/alpha crystallin family protein [Candidatus Tyrphobacter sp.]
MSNLSTTSRGSLARNGFDILGWDPLRSLFGGWNSGFGIDVTRTETGYDVEMPVAGFKPEQIEVTVEDGVLTASGKAEKRSFRRSIVLPESIDPDAIDAKVDNGLLTLTLKLHAKAQPKRIEVKNVSIKNVNV